MNSSIMHENTILSKELEYLLNRTCRENRSNTPDFILASFLMQCLLAFESANNAREAWYGKALTIMGVQDLGRSDGLK